MLGLLCSQGRERAFEDLLKSSAELKESGVPVLVFSMPNLNLNERTVYGIEISQGAAATLKTQLPSFIFNFAVQYKKSHIKKLKSLMETDNVSLINPVNVFNQWTILKMLTSDVETKKFVLPYFEIADDEVPDFKKFGSFILKPQNGNDSDKIIYCKKADWGFDLYNVGGVMHSRLTNIQSAVAPAIRDGNWILLVSPKLPIDRDGLMTIRGYLQKSADGVWKVVAKANESWPEQEYAKRDPALDAALLKMMRHIGCFIPDLNFCALDFVTGGDGTPYFLGLSGWQDLTVKKPQRAVLMDALCRSLKEYSEKF